MSSIPLASLRSLLALSLLALLTTAGEVHAMSASPEAFAEEQPDGTHIHLHLEGDEFFHWLEDARGFTVVKDREWFVYGQLDREGRVVPTGLRVGVDNPAKAGLLPRQLPDAAFRQGLGSAQQADGSASATGSAVSALQGTLPNLVVLLRFSDHAARGVPSTSDIDILMNAPGGHGTLAPTGSVRDVYLENSYNQLTLDSTVAYWVTLPNTEAYYANGNSGLTTRTHEALRYALNTLDADTNIHFTDYDSDNDGQIDAITFLHSGYAAEFGGTSSDGANYVDRMWSHKWGVSSGGWTSSDGVNVGNYHISPAIWGTSGTTIGRIGVICHETGHFLGLPDLYDGNDSDGDGTSGSGIGSYGLMANSWGFDNSQYYPPHMSAWSKMQLGWVTPTVIDTAGSYSLIQAETSAAAYRIDLGYNTNEYLLIENRQPVGTDSVMPQGGLAIFHIDDSASYVQEGFPAQSGWPGNGNHYRVALLQADGAYELERGIDRGDRYDVYHGNGVSEVGPNTTPNTDSYQGGNIVLTNNRVFNISSAGSTMTFDFEVVGAATPPNAPAALTAQAISYEQINLTWSDQSNDETGFKVERNTGGGWAEIATAGSNATGYSDTGLTPSTAYNYRVRAFNLGGSSSYSNTTSATTQSPPPPPAAPSNLTANVLSDTAIDLIWTDNAATEDGFRVDRSLDGLQWDNMTSLAANTTSFSDTGLNGSTTYSYRVRAFTGWGESISGNITATTDSPPPFELATADADWAVSGSVSGNYTRTVASDNSAQTLTEIRSGGRPSRRYSFLDHRWRFDNVRGGHTVSLFVEADAPANNEGDDFAFEYSTNGGNSWSVFSPPIVIQNGSSPDIVTAGAFPDDTRGEVYVRVIDTNTTAGSTGLDSISIDHLVIQTDIDSNDFPPMAPSNVSAVVQSASAVAVSWDDKSDNERGFEIWRSSDNVNWISVGSAAIDATSHIDSAVTPATLYSYSVSSYTASYQVFSGASNAVTTPDGLAITRLSGGKSKGKIYVDLSWLGGATLSLVDVYRSTNGGAFSRVITATANDGSQRDSTTLKGGATLTYRVQSADGSIVSNGMTISF